MDRTHLTWLEPLNRWLWTYLTATGLILQGGKGSSPPPAPDYTGAARAQGAANVETAIAEGILNRPNEVTPYGTRTWNQTGTYGLPSGTQVPIFTGTNQLTPLGTERFNQEERIIGQLGNIAEQGVGRVGNVMETPFSSSGVNDLQNKAEQAYFQRLDPQLSRARQARETQLLTTGHAPGGKAWQSAQQDIGQQENDARQQAILAAFGIRPQALQEEMAIRNIPLNEVNALRTGAPVNIPQFQPYGQVSVGQTPLYNAALQSGQYGTDVYNANQAGANAQTAGLYGLGGTALTAAAIFF